jgi:hypothetical protein
MPGPRRISHVPCRTVHTFRSHYADGSIGAALPRSLHLPWPSPAIQGLGSRSGPLARAVSRRLRRIPHRTDRMLARRPSRRLCHGASASGSPLQPPTSYTAAWSLPWPDSHRLAQHSFSWYTNRKRLVLVLWHASSLPPEASTPVDRIDIPGEPAPSLHRHPSEQRLRSYYGPVRRRAPHRYSMPPVSAVGTLPLTTFGAYDPGRRIDARLLTFRARAADRAHAASTPDTTWPIHGHPPGPFSREEIGPSISMPSKTFRRLNDDAQPNHPGRALLERLPGPHLTQSSHAFSLDAHHDSLQLTQLQGGLAPAPVGRRWRANKPPSLAQHRL